MTRCPNCRAANPEAQAQCLSCGQPLPAQRVQPWLRASELWDPAAARRAALAATALLLLRVTLFPLLWQAGGRVEGKVLFFHLSLGLGTGLALAWTRRPADLPTRIWAWAALGALGGVFAWSVDYAYNYQHLVYRGVLLAQEFFFGSDGPQASTFPYSLLQVLAAAPVALALWAYHGSLTRQRPALGALALIFITFSLSLRFWTRGALLQWEHFHPGWLGQWGMYWGAFSLLFYGLKTPKTF